MMKKIPKICQVILCLSLFEFLITRPTNAFFPKINEPNQQELESTSIQIGKTAIQLIQFGQANEAIKLLELAIKLNPKEASLWITLAEAQVRSEKKNEALLSLSEAIQLKPKEESIYFSKASILWQTNGNPPRLKKTLLVPGIRVLFPAATTTAIFLAINLIYFSN